MEGSSGSLDGRGPVLVLAWPFKSQTGYNSGLFVLQMDHVPTACGAWPAFWMFGAASIQNEAVFSHDGIIKKASELLRAVLGLRPLSSRDSGRESFQKLRLGFPDMPPLSFLRTMRSMCGLDGASSTYGRQSTPRNAASRNGRTRVCSRSCQNYDVLVWGTPSYPRQLQLCTRVRTAISACLGQNIHATGMTSCGLYVRMHRGRITLVPCTLPCLPEASRE